MKHQIFWTSQSSKVVDFLTSMCWTQMWIWRRWTRMNCCIASLFIRNTFEGILKSQLIRFLTICNNMEDFHEATSILFKVLCEKLCYPGRFLRQIKAKFLWNYQLPGITNDPIGDALKCKSRRYQCSLYLDEESHFSDDDFDFPIFVGLNFFSKNMWVKQAIV